MVTRRRFIVLATAITGGMAIGVAAPWALDLKRRLTPAKLFGEDGWIEINAQGEIEIKSTLTEMGQGVWTTIAQIVAEELNTDLASIKVTMASAWRKYAAPIGFITGGSTSASRLFQHMRTIAANARHRLVLAGAESMQANAQECTIENGFVVHMPSNRRIEFGQIAASAAKIAAPEAVAPKPKSDWRILGKPAALYGAEQIVTGQMHYGLDLSLPGMLVAAVSQKPSPTATLASLDRSAALNSPGVIRLVELDDTIAVVANTYWQAQSALDKARVEWRSEPIDSEQLRAQLLAKLDARPALKSSESQADDSIDVIATYETPLLMHAQMEPLNATAKVGRLSAELWVPTQAQQMMQSDVAQALGLWAHMVTVHTPRLGGGFGRRLATDYGVTAARIAREFDVPVKSVWSRDEDSRQGRFRTMSAARLHARVSRVGEIRAWQANLALVGNQDRTGGLSNKPYNISAAVTAYDALEPGIRTGSWRSVDASQNVFYRESFIDECAQAVNIDPLTYRKNLLAGNTRAQRVIDELGIAANWQASKSEGKSLGVAFNDDFGSPAGAVAEVETDSSGGWRVTRLYLVVDCGVALNPAAIQSQLEGGALFGLSAALYENAHFTEGKLTTTNYQAYRVLRLNEAPELIVKILESEDAEIGGIGEVAVPLVAPAVANALFMRSKLRHRRLPLAALGPKTNANA